MIIKMLQYQVTVFKFSLIYAMFLMLIMFKEIASRSLALLRESKLQPHTVWVLKKKKETV